MGESDKQYYEVSSREKPERIEQAAAQLLLESRADVESILTNHGIPPAKVADITDEIVRHPPDVQYEGAGTVAATIAICIALTKLIKTLTPLLQPFSREGAKLAYVVGLDVWKMLRKKLLVEKSVRLTEKPAKTPRKQK